MRLHGSVGRREPAGGFRADPWNLLAGRLRHRGKARPLPRPGATMSPISDNVFDQHDSDERAARVKRMIVGGAAFTAVGGAVAGATALKGDDDLSFPDEADDTSIDKAIKATESKADAAPAHDPVAAAPQPVAAAVAPPAASEPPAHSEPAMAPADPQVKEV